MGDGASLDGVVREGFSEEAAFEQIPQGDREVNSMNIWEKSSPGSGNSMGKGPVTDACLACSGKSREASVAGVREGESGEEGNRVIGDQVIRDREPYQAQEGLLTSCSVIWKPLKDFK